MCKFIISVRTKDGKDYDPSSLRSLLASFKRHLKKNNFPASIMNDLIFEETRKVLLSKQKELKKKGKGNKLYAQKRPEKIFLRKSENSRPVKVTSAEQLQGLAE